MSVSLWAWVEECDKRICTGDCDMCSYAEDDGDYRDYEYDEE